MSDYYEVLGVSRQATTDEIKRAYKKKARKLHPDVAGPGHEDEFKAVNAAYEVLSDSDKRQMYDLGGEDAVHGGGGFGAGGISDSDLSPLGSYAHQEMCGTSSSRPSSAAGPPRAVRRPGRGGGRTRS